MTLTHTPIWFRRFPILYPRCNNILRRRGRAAVITRKSILSRDRMRCVAWKGTSPETPLCFFSHFMFHTAISAVLSITKCWTFGTTLNPIIVQIRDFSHQFMPANQSLIKSIQMILCVFYVTQLRESRIRKVFPSLARAYQRARQLVKWLIKVLRVHVESTKPLNYLANYYPRLMNIPKDLCAYVVDILLLSPDYHDLGHLAS
ncbi:hypothetical protein F4825DRAFT_401035 [Nemania diffusa]|nr:hypothetical protein F4825DRAFT_401035 [Nemania diffusa]